MNTNPNINIILSRETDVYQSPIEKVEFANDKNADLFISIHVDAVKDNADKVNGMTVWVSKNEFDNAAKSKLFASAIIGEFANNYQLNVSPFPQQREIGITVLQKTHCPAVVIETGFITNNTDLRYLQTDAAKETIAKNVLAAISKYASQLNSGIETSVPAKILSKISDTIRVKATEEKNKINENTLFIVDAKILGRGKKVLQQIEKLSADKLQDQHIVSMNVLSKEQAKIKYDLQGEDGAIEITTSHAVTAKPKEEKVEYAGVENKRDSLPDDKVFTQVENEASFPEGSIGWRNFLTKNLDPTIPVKDGMKPGSYKVMVSFIVKKDGSISNVTADNYQGTAMAKSCIDLIKKGPKWLPAMQNGHQVTAYRKQPITFVVSAD